MRNISLAMLAALLLANNAYADGMQIVANDVTWQPQVEPTLPFLLGIKNTGTPDLLSAWQLTCTIINTPDSVGTVWFSAANVPLDNYVFAGASGPDDFFPPALTAPATTIGPMFGYTSVGVAGKDVPTTVVNLVELDLVASNNAAGRFDVAVVPDHPLSDDCIGAAWCSTDLDVEREFDGMLFEGGPVVVGSVQVTPVPEPSSVILLALTLAVSAASVGWHRRRKFLGLFRMTDVL